MVMDRHGKPVNRTSDETAKDGWDASRPGPDGAWPEKTSATLDEASLAKIQGGCTPPDKPKRIIDPPFIVE